jgi:hypothetical protein
MYMAEYIDTEDGTVYPLMEAEDFEAIPEGFSAYVAKRPEILPSYSAFAPDAFDVIERRSSDLILLQGDHGIGKTTRLIPELLRAAEQRGYRNLGSLSILKGFSFGGSISYNAHLDGHRSTLESSPYELLETEEGSQTIIGQLRARFQSTEGQKGFFVLDEGVDTARDNTLIANTIFREAARAGVQIAVVDPIKEYAPRAAAKYRAIGHIADKPLQAVAIPEQLVAKDEIKLLVRAIGVEALLAERINSHPVLRRLRVVARLGDQLLKASSQHRDDDDSIWEVNFPPILSVINNTLPESEQDMYGIHNMYGVSRTKLDKARETLLGGST